MIRLSPRQQAALTFCLTYERTHGRPPTLDELAQHLGATRQYAQQIRVKIAIRRGIALRQHQQRPSLTPTEGVATVPAKVNSEG